VTSIDTLPKRYFYAWFERWSDIVLCQSMVDHIMFTKLKPVSSLYSRSKFCCSHWLWL